MKTTISAFLCALCMSITACTKSDEPGNLNVGVSSGQEMDTVTIRFTRYEMEAMTRVAVSEVSSYLDVWIYEDGAEVTDIHQVKDDAGFGTVSVRLDKNRTYTLYAAAHKGDGQATLSDGIISWPDDKIRDTFYGTATFSPADGTSVSCELRRIISQLKIVTTDAVPEETARLTVEIAGAHDRWSVTDGAVHETVRTASFTSIGTHDDGTASFTVSVIAAPEQTAHDVTVKAYNTNGQVILDRTFQDVPLRNGYRTVYSGELFTSKSMTVSFTAADTWTDMDFDF